MIIRVLNELFKSNSFLVCSDFDNKCVIIDPGLNEDDLDSKIIKLKLNPVAILATHGHFDHIGGASYFKTKYNIPFYLHSADIKLMKSANFFLKLSKINRLVSLTEPDCFINQKVTQVSVLESAFEIYNFPGHTEGSCIIKYKSNIFSGDTIFKNGLYVNKLPGENIEELRKSILSILNTFELNNICYPGHGSHASLDYIKENNQELKAFLTN